MLRKFEQEVTGAGIHTLFLYIAAEKAEDVHTYARVGCITYCDQGGEGRGHLVVVAAE